MDIKAQAAIATGQTAGGSTVDIHSSRYTKSPTWSISRSALRTRKLIPVTKPDVRNRRDDRKRHELILSRLKPYLFQRASHLKHHFERSHHLVVKSKQTREYYMPNCFKQFGERCLRSNLIVK